MADLTILVDGTPVPVTISAQGPRGLTGAAGTVAANTGIVIGADQATPSGTDQTGQELVTFNAVTGLLDTAGGSNSIPGMLGRTVARVTNGPGGNENYYNTVYWFAGNADENLARIVSGKGVPSFRLETNYYQGCFGMEAHIGFFPASGSSYGAGGEHRAFYSFSPHAAADRANSFVLISSDQTSLLTYDGTQLLKFQRSGSGGFGQMFNSFYFQGMVNDVPLQKQVNAAVSAYLDLSYIDAEDRQKTVLPTTHTAAAASSASVGVTAHQLAIYSSPADSQYGHFGVAYTGVTGSWTVRHDQISVSVQLLDTVQNTHATGAAARRVSTTGGDAKFQSVVNDVYISFGQRGSDGKLCFNFGATLADGDAPGLQIDDSTYRVTLFGGMTIPIASVPNHADDAAAAAGSVPVGGIYRNGSILMIRAA